MNVLGYGTVFNEQGFTPGFFGSGGNSGSTFDLNNLENWLIENKGLVIIGVSTIVLLAIMNRG